MHAVAELGAVLPGDVAGRIPFNLLLNLEDSEMTTFDLSPLYRTAIGFDRLADLLSNAQRVEGGGYPPYNIESRGDDDYRISMAVAGFAEEELDIVSEQNTLTISGSKADEAGDEERQYLYRGIATRTFERRFQLADHVKVVNAQLENGLLHIDLKRELPERMKPRKIEISSGRPSIEGHSDERSARAA